MILKVYNPEYQPSDKEIWAKLKEADLEGHGYKKEQTVKLVSEPGSDKPVYKKKYYFYKIVDCSRLQEIIEELATLMPKDGKYLILKLPSGTLAIKTNRKKSKTNKEKGIY